MALVMKVRLNGVEYPLDKWAKKLTVWQYLELEEQAGITIDDLESGQISSSAKALAAWAFMIRRHQGEDITFRQAAEEVVPADFIAEEVPDEDPTSAPTASVRGEGHEANGHVSEISENTLNPA